MIHPIKTYQWLVPLFRLRYCKSVEIDEQSENLTAILENNPRLMCIMSHGPTLAPVATIPGLIDLMIKAGGGERKALAIIWRPFYKVPLLKNFAAYVTNTAKGLSTAECLRRYHEGFNDITLMPEGDFSLFGNGQDIEPFVSPKFIELALKIKAPILIGAHQGTEAWGRVIPIPQFVVPLFKPLLSKNHFDLLSQNKQINIPRFMRRLKKMRFTFRLYQPTVTLLELNKIKNSRQKTQQLKEEAQKIQQIMQEMVESLRNK